MICEASQRHRQKEPRAMTDKQESPCVFLMLGEMPYFCTVHYSYLAERKDTDIPHVSMLPWVNGRVCAEFLRYEKRREQWMTKYTGKCKTCGSTELLYLPLRCAVCGGGIKTDND